MDRFAAITAYAAVCDARGFAPAARKLGLSPSVVTRQVAALEERLGVRLLQRTTRSVRMTDAGARFLERARRILADVDEAEASAQRERAEPKGRLSIAAPMMYGRLHVAPLLAEYLRRYPQVSAELHLSDRNVNLIEEGHDLAIRIGHLADSQLIARKIGETRRALAASPAYLKRHGQPRRPGDLVRFDLIAFIGLTPAHEWRFVDRGKDVRVRVAPRYATNSGDTALVHAIGGGGIVAALCYQLRAPLAKRQLVEVLGNFAPPPDPIHAVYPSSRLLSSKVRAFLEILEQNGRGRRIPGR